MTRYTVTSRKTAAPDAVRALERAFARMGVGESRALADAQVLTSEGQLQIVIDIDDSTGSARIDGVEAFATAWYDAFGERESGLGFLIEEST